MLAASLAPEPHAASWSSSCAAADGALDVHDLYELYPCLGEDAPPSSLRSRLRHHGGSAAGVGGEAHSAVVVVVVVVVAGIAAVVVVAAVAGTAAVVVVAGTVVVVVVAAGTAAAAAVVAGVVVVAAAGNAAAVEKDCWDILAAFPAALPLAGRREAAVAGEAAQCCLPPWAVVVVVVVDLLVDCALWVGYESFEVVVVVVVVAAAARESESTPNAVHSVACVDLRLRSAIGCASSYHHDQEFAWHFARDACRAERATSTLPPAQCS